MAKYRKISPRIWSDAKFMSLSDDAQLLFIFILTHPHLSSVGAMRASIAGLAAEKRWTSERVSKGFQELFRKGLAKHDESASFLVVPNFIKYNEPENPNVVKAWRNSFDELPECDLYYWLFSHIQRFLEGFSEGFQEPFRKGLPKGEGDEFVPPLPNQEQEQEQEQEQKKDTSFELETSSSQLVEVIDDPIFILIPLVRKGEEYPVTESVIREFEANYPAVDVRQQLRSFRSWSLTHPKKRKTKRGILASINSWLTKHQDRPTQKQTHATAYKLSAVEHNQLLLEQIRAEERQKREQEPHRLEDDHAVH